MVPLLMHWSFRDYYASLCRVFNKFPQVAALNQFLNKVLQPKASFCLISLAL
ncbi:hypothetical protein A2U01_0085904, partial [Trifolium medium]|nr:hypothetical protein [Trifolium medium]